MGGKVSGMARSTDPRIVWLPAYDAYNDAYIWMPTFRESVATKPEMARFVQNEPGEGKVRWDAYDRLVSSRSPVVPAKLV